MEVRAFEERWKGVCIAFERHLKGYIALYCICIALYLYCVVLYCIVFVLRRIAFYYICISNGLSIRYLVKKDEFN